MKIVYGFFYNWNLIGNGKFSLLLGEYQQLAVNVLTSGPKMSYLIKNNFFELNLAQNEEKVG